MCACFVLRSRHWPDTRRSDFVPPVPAQTVIEGMGELHLDIIVDRLRREFSVSCEVGAPQVSFQMWRSQFLLEALPCPHCGIGVCALSLQAAAPPQVNYRESISRPSDVRYVHKKQSGGSGQFADVAIKFEPAEPGTGFEFRSEIKGGAIPKEYIPGVTKVSVRKNKNTNLLHVGRPRFEGTTQSFAPRLQHERFAVLGPQTSPFASHTLDNDCFAAARWAVASRLVPALWPK